MYLVALAVNSFACFFHLEHTNINLGEWPGNEMGTESAVTIHKRVDDVPSDLILFNLDFHVNNTTKEHGWLLVHEYIYDRGTTVVFFGH